MKIAVICLAIVSILGADEINRMESIVEDISSLRKNYEQCQKELESKNLQNIAPKIEVKKERISTCQKEKLELKNYKQLLKQEQNKNQVLTQKVELATKENSNITKMDKIILELRKELENKNKLLKNKEKEIVSLKNDFSKNREIETVSLKSVKNETAPKKRVVVKVCKDENSFPKLMMKDSTSNNSVKNENIYKIKPTTFRLKENSNIYNSIDGQKVDEWEKNSSFTSNIRSNGWIKITGYFVNRIWQKSSKELWVESKNVIQR